MFAEFHRRRSCAETLYTLRARAFSDRPGRASCAAPVDHVARQRHAPQLYLKPRISFRAPVGRVRAPHRAGDAARTADQLVVVEDFIPLLDLPLKLSSASAVAGAWQAPQLTVRSVESR